MYFVICKSDKLQTVLEGLVTKNISTQLNAWIGGQEQIYFFEECFFIECLIKMSCLHQQPAQLK